MYVSSAKSLPVCMLIVPGSGIILLISSISRPQGHRSSARIEISCERYLLFTPTLTAYSCKYFSASPQSHTHAWRSGVQHSVTTLDTTGSLRILECILQLGVHMPDLRYDPIACFSFA